MSFNANDGRMYKLREFAAAVPGTKGRPDFITESRLPHALAVNMTMRMVVHLGAAVCMHSKVKHVLKFRIILGKILAVIGVLTVLS